MSITERRLRWKRFAQRPGTATGKAAVQRLATDLIRLKVKPDSLGDADIVRLRAALVAGGRADAAAEINSFIEGYNARTRGARLTRLPNEADRREAAAQTLCGPALLAEIDAFVSRRAASGAVGGLKAGIVRMVGLLADQDAPIATLEDLLTPQAIAAIGYRAPTTSRLERAVPAPSARALRAGARLGVRGRRRAEAAAAAAVSPMAEPSQARLHYYSILETIALDRGDAEALHRLSQRREASARIDPTIPAATAARLAPVQDTAGRDAVLAALAQALVDLLGGPHDRSPHFQACGLIAVLVAFVAGRRPADLVGLGSFAGEATVDGGRYLMEAATGRPGAWVPREIAVLIEMWEAWMAPHRQARAHTWLLETPAGEAFEAQALAHHMGKALTAVGTSLRPKDLKDWTGIELLRAGTDIERVADYLRFATTEACEARFKLVREALDKRGHADMITLRAGLSDHG